MRASKVRLFRSHKPSLHTAEGEEGLMGAYYNNEDLSGNPKVARVDKTISFDWGDGKPDPTVNDDKFLGSVDWKDRSDA